MGESQKLILTRDVLVLILIAGTGRGEVGVPGQGLHAAGDALQVDCHLAGLQVQQAGLVHHVAQSAGQVGCHARDLELGAPDVGCDLNQLVALLKGRRTLARR